MTDLKIQRTFISLEKRSGMPTNGELIDRYGRVHTDLRISVTDRCNFRCIYCLPDGNLPTVPKKMLLSFEEILRIAGILKRLGIKTVRLTGGEPLLRRNLPQLVSGLNSLDFEDISLTTNAYYLKDAAKELKAAGLKRVNISLDSLCEEKFANIRRRGDLIKVLRGLEAAKSVGLDPIKVNVVVMAGVNEDELAEFIPFAEEMGVTVRFIEYMPLDSNGAWSLDKFVPFNTILNKISERWNVIPCDNGDSNAPASYFKVVGKNVVFGIIGSITEQFCGSCNRLRLTSDGTLRNCLFASEETSLLNSLREDSSDKEVEMLIRKAVWGKKIAHGTDQIGLAKPSRSMSMVGG